MSDKFNPEARIEIIYFSNEKVDQQETLFKGGIAEWRNEVGLGWDGFDLGDSFFLNDEKVRVFKHETTTGDTGFITKAIYFIAPETLNSHKIQYEKLIY
ncbi:hypothetical protein [Oceanobacillus sp. J11TS1]|uniref:hypothetical protein n=1 Tax=Oceanobacillus sp. J11TS1 TaxID=2807191 RepID=UPI001B088594|nr:hypothetical protein [Oceanobacillus sp. J11TS1]GIO25087.1 hypothetical protein J11TS1_36680 [Oceanobacillus sp. J11TS1]